MEFPTESITVSELIRERVYQEVDEYNRADRTAASKAYRGLVQPQEIEEQLNGRRTARVREVDWKKQFELATQAFEKRGIMQVPGRRFGPPRPLELMLNVKQPNADGCRKQRDRHVDKKERPSTYQPYHHHDYQRDGCVGGHSTDPGTPIGHQPDRQPVLHDEKIGRTQAKHDDWIAIEAIAKTPPPS